jgi:pantoate kinase
VLTNDRMRATINIIGKRCLEEFELDQTLPSFSRLSKRFAVESGFASPEALRAISAAERFGQASMAMLGNSVFAFGEVDRLEEVLQNFGTTFRTRVDAKVPRLIN